MTTAIDHLDCVVIGAGVVGLSIARALAQQGREVVLMEAQDSHGTQVSARNSEVIHAGMYYPSGSLKAQLCVRGNAQLYAYCQARGIAHAPCGKLIVATDEAQIPVLRHIQSRAMANGLAPLPWLTREEVQDLEPALRCEAALQSPTTGIVDASALMLSLLGDVENAGGMLVARTRVEDGSVVREGLELRTQDGHRLVARTVVNAAGLGAVELARKFTGLSDRWQAPVQYLAKGSYFALAGRSPFSRLIYPVPQHGGLGVHLTLDLGGQARFGPDVQWVDRADDLQVDPQRAQDFYASVRSYWPDLPDGALVPAYAGMRPKISGPQEDAADFRIEGPEVHGAQGLIQLFGIESPGLTSCLAIGDYVAQLLAAQSQR